MAVMRFMMAFCRCSVPGRDPIAVSRRRNRRCIWASFSNVGAKRVNVRALPGHVDPTTNWIDTGVDRDRVAAVANKFQGFQP